MLDRDCWLVLGGISGLLTLASIIAVVLRFVVTAPDKRATIENLFDRTISWWAMVAIFTLAMWLGKVATLVLFALISFRALREVVTLTYTRRGDHRMLFWAFVIAVPLQYVLIGVDWYGLFVVMLPVWGFIFFSIRSALAGDVTRFHERAGRVFWAVMICVYCVSHAPGLLLMDLPTSRVDAPIVLGYGPKLLIFLLAVTQLSDVLQYCWGKPFGRHKVVPKLSPGKTWEGLIGGVLSASAIGAGLYWLTPFAAWEAGLLALEICIMGFFGGLVMSAIKRDAGVKDWGTLIPGHGGVMDRIDSLSFAAPVFFHTVRYVWG
jgi:phosphatidate cytidylyltransferase